MIHGEVVSDPEQPGGERNRLPPEAADRLQHPHEGLRRQVLGVVPVADAQVQIAVDAIEVEEVQLLERVAVTVLPTFDERPHVRGRSRPSARLFRRHPEGMPPEAPRNSAAAEADTALARKALDVDDPGERDRVPAVLGFELERAAAAAPTDCSSSSAVSFST